MSESKIPNFVLEHGVAVDIQQIKPLLVAHLSSFNLLQTSSLWSAMQLRL